MLRAATLRSERKKLSRKTNSTRKSLRLCLLLSLATNSRRCKKSAKRQEEEDKTELQLTDCHCFVALFSCLLRKKEDKSAPNKTNQTLASQSKPANLSILNGESKSRQERRQKRFALRCAAFVRLAKPSSFRNERLRQARRQAGSKSGNISCFEACELRAESEFALGFIICCT